MTTENSDVGAMLQGLEPKTEFTEFAALWDGIKAARDRKVSRKAIYEKLIAAGSLSISYVTFTRFVKKMEEEGNSGMKNHKLPSIQDVGMSVEAGDVAATSIEDIDDKSAKVVTAAASALDETKSKQRGKDYSKLVGKK